MTGEDLILHLFCMVDDAMEDITKHPQARLYPSELVTIGLLFALKGAPFRTFYPWLQRALAPHPAREGRSPRRVGRKGKSNYRWIVGIKL